MRLIDRNTVLNRYQEICKGIACMDCPFNKDGCAVEKLILESAVVDAEPVRHGKWIEHHEPYTWMGYTYWSCSECGFECGYEKDITIRTNYCPNCGAKMEAKWLV